MLFCKTKNNIINKPILHDFRQYKTTKNVNEHLGYQETHMNITYTTLS